MEDPVRLQECKDAIAAGYPAYILHPSITPRCIRRLAGRMCIRMNFITSCTDNDSKAQTSKKLTQLDHLRGLVTDRVEKGAPLTDMEVKEYLKDFDVDLTDNAAECYRTAANSPFAGYILDRCAECKLRILPVPLGSVIRVAGKHVYVTPIMCFNLQRCGIP